MKGFEIHTRYMNDAERKEFEAKMKATEKHLRRIREQKKTKPIQFDVLTEYQSRRT